jgi:hypothetical protein
MCVADYLYNGVRLPAISVGLKTYKAIYIKNELYYLAARTSGHVISSGGGVLLNQKHCTASEIQAGLAYDVYKIIDGVWVQVDASDEMEVPLGDYTPVWSNHDIKQYNNSSVVVFEASQPIPVPTLDPSVFLTGWHMGQLIRSLRIYPEPPKYSITFINDILYISNAPAKQTNDVLSLSAVDAVSDAGGE